VPVGEKGLEEVVEVVGPASSFPNLSPEQVDDLHVLDDGPAAIADINVGQVIGASRAGEAEERSGNHDRQRELQ
jgi:hypothetical protein